MCYIYLVYIFPCNKTLNTNNDEGKCQNRQVAVGSPHLQDS